MKSLRRLFDRIAPKFAKGGPLARWFPLFEATDTFLFHSRRTTAVAPHIRDAVDYKRIMITVIIALVPCVFMALWNTGYQANAGLQQLGLPLPAGWRGMVMTWTGCDPANTLANLLLGALYFLPIYLVTVVVGSFWEGLFNLVRGHEISEAFLVTSLLFPLTLPPTVPLWQVALGISFGIIFAKEVFGGVGRNFMNPALVSRAFLYFAYPLQMTGDTVWTAVDGLTSATPLAVLAASPPAPVSAALPFGWGEAFVGSIPGSMGETSTLACVLGAGFLLLTGIASWRVMAAMLLGGVVAATAFWLSPNPPSALYALPPHWHLVLGGFAFGLVFMITDPVSSAQTPLGQWLYGGLVGVMAIVIRVANPAFPEGTMLAILLGNVCAPLFDYFVIQANIRRRKLRHG